MDWWFLLCVHVCKWVCVDLKASSAIHSFPSCSCNFPLRGDLLPARSSLSRLGWPWGSTGPHPHPFSAAPALELQVCDTPHPLSLLFWGWDADGTPYACKLSTLPTELSPQPLFWYFTLWRSGSIIYAIQLLADDMPFSWDCEMVVWSLLSSMFNSKCPPLPSFAFSPFLPFHPPEIWLSWILTMKRKRPPAGSNIASHLAS